MMTFIVWDVQHGNAAYLKTPSSHFVFDLGAGKYGSQKEFSPLNHIRNKYGVSRLDAVVITHPHRDHLDDIDQFNALSPRFFWRPRHLSELDIRNANQGKDSSIIDAYLKIDKHYTHTIKREENPFLSNNNGGVEIEIFSPYKCASSNINNHSLVAVVTYASSKLLIPGDNESASWDVLLEMPEFRSAIKGTDILLAPHHGRNSGFSENLFEHISPYLVIVSDGCFCDTSATTRYSKKARGWKVQKRNGGTENRKCLTTRKDGVIVTKFGKNLNDKPFMEVTIN